MHSGKLTKVIATFGPAIDSDNLIKEAILAGVNIFRFNMKHNKTEWHINRIEKVQKIADELKIKIGILIDLQGPEIRIETPHELPLDFKKEEVITFSTDFVGEKGIKVPHEIVLSTLEVGDFFSIEDGFHEFSVTKKVSSNTIEAIIRDSGILKHKKTLNLVGKNIELPSLIDSDLDRLDLATKTRVDFIALSYVRSERDIQILRHEMQKRKINAQIVAKIESQKGLDEIDSIISETDALMIARGDLGVETPIEKIPKLQVEIIEKCRNAAKPVIVATQMLESMIDKPLPTRAEAADVANAVFNQTDCVMLSGESAVGKYPIKAIEYMTKIVKYNEGTNQNYKFVPDESSQTHSIVKAAMSVMETDLGAKIDKVVVFTETGYTARVLSSYRPKVPVIAVSDSNKTVETLTINFGILGENIKLPEDDFANPRTIVEQLSGKFITEGERVLIIHGNQWKEPGKTNGLFILDSIL